MSICITGMHRSGTSLVANLLHQCGLYLGEERDLLPASADNEKGYWENRQFVKLNDDVLKELGGRWNAPPAVLDGWAEESRFLSLRLRAELLLEKFTAHKLWGWKDPRNCLTFPFWASLDSLKMPFWLGFASNLKVIVCLRNPLEVFRSLRDRRYTPDPAGLKLWSIYNRAILNSTLPRDRIITHYEAYFQDAPAELRRVLNFLEIPVSDELVERGSTLLVANHLRHNQARAEHLIEENLGPEIFNLYGAMCHEANYPAPFSAND